MIKQQMFIGAALLTGVAIGYFAAPQGSGKVETETPPAEAPAVAPAKNGNADAEIKALRARIRELERSRRAEPSGESVAKDESRADDRGRRRDGQPGANQRSRREMIADMKKNNPQTYAAMTNGIANANRERLERHQRKLDFFSSIDTSRMSASARATHGALQDLIVRRETIDDGVDWDNLSDEELRNQYEKRREIEGEISRLSEIERRNLIQETAKELGLQGGGVEDFAATIQDIYDATETPNWWRRRGPGGGRGGRGGRGPGPR